MNIREANSADTGIETNVRLKNACLRLFTNAMSCASRDVVVRLCGKIPWQAAAAGMVLLVLALLIYGIPHRDRVRMEAKVRSVFTRAPVLMVGDSITYEAAPSHLCDAEVFNAAVPGDRIADLLSDAVGYAKRLPASRVVVAVGVNDSWPKHKDLASWTSQYRALLALYAGRDLVLVEINPIDPSRSHFVARLDADFIAAANAAIRQIAAQAGARVVEAPAIALTRDGLHPSPIGTALWRDRLSAAACG